MSDRTSIEWTDATWNPWQGCHKISAGCKNCYMFRDRKRYGQDPNVVIRSKSHTFNLPLRLRLKVPQLVFTCSWSDFFIEEADPWRAEAWEIIRRTPHLTYQILTKRIERAAEFLPWGDGDPWPNVWLIVSAENQETLELRVPKLLNLSAAVRGISAEPLLGPLDLRGLIQKRCMHSHPFPFLCDDVAHDRRGIDWLILGGESGPGARPMDLLWARNVMHQCRLAGVPLFVKQLGSTPFVRDPILDQIARDAADDPQNDPADVAAMSAAADEWLKLKDPKGGDPSEWPPDLRVREFPK